MALQLPFTKHFSIKLYMWVKCRLFVFCMLFYIGYKIKICTFILIATKLNFWLLVEFCLALVISSRVISVHFSYFIQMSCCLSDLSELSLRVVTLVELCTLWSHSRLINVSKDPLYTFCLWLRSDELSWVHILCGYGVLHMSGSRRESVTLVAAAHGAGQMNRAAAQLSLVKIP